MPETKFEEQAKTLAEARRLLKTYHKCMVIRPTGFGKTWLLTELIKDYKKVLYLYPSAVVRDTVVDRYYDLPDPNEDEPLDPETVDTYRQISFIPNCTLMTYAKLVRLSKSDFEAMDFDLVICDEAHRLGGARTKAAMEFLFATLPSTCDFIGATATPTRMDNFDPCSHFYADHMCYAYTLHDAIGAGMIAKPHYCYATYDFRRDLENAAKESGQDLKDPSVSDVINAKVIELAKIYAMPKVIREVCDKYAKDTDYMKFIVFFANKLHMKQKITEVEAWFQEAYPDHAIKTLRISSSTDGESRNTDKLPLLTRRPKTIDLIACIDMLNLGYHVADQTGIMMYRGTQSNTIFTQQLGRALSAGADGSAIVFDIVDNLHRKAAYELYVKTPATRQHRVHAKNDDYVFDKTTGRILYNDPAGDQVPTQYHVDPDTGKIVDKNGNPSTFGLNDDGQVVNHSNAASPEKDINRVTADCLEATGHEATYREILAKAMAEPMSHRCKYALQLHFRSWCLNHNIPYPISDKELSEIYGLDIADFYDEFRRIIAEKKIDYPLQDAESLMRVGNDGSTDAPLAICCEATGVSVQTVLDMLFQ